jgi:hypothetical protein
MKKIVLLVGPLVTYTYYAAQIDLDPHLKAVLKASFAEALEFAASGNAEIAAVVTNLMSHCGSRELGTHETGDGYSFTGAAIIKHLRKDCPKAIFFLIGGNQRTIVELAEYSGETADIVRLDQEYAVTPQDLVTQLNEFLSSHVPA